MSIFMEFFRTFFLWSKKHSFLFRILKNVSLWLFLLKKNIREKGRFFDKNHGLNALQNVDFFDFARTSLFRSKKHAFLFTISKNVSFWLYLLKRTHRKRSIFWEKPWTKRFAKCRFFRLFRTSLCRSKKHSFLSRISKNVSFRLFLVKKKTYNKAVEFWQKPWTNPFAKCRFFLLC